jgi:IclR family acetate operon transcriptional repressor
MAGKTMGAQSLTRALDVLECLEETQGSLGVTEIARRLDLPAATVHRLVQALLARGYVRQLPDRRYNLGSRLSTLGASATSLVVRRAAPVLRMLAAETGESANLAMFTSGYAEYVGQAPGTRSMRMFTEVGRQVPLFCTGVGKAILASLPESEAERIASREPYEQHTPSTLMSPSALLRDIERIRETGYAIDEGEMEQGVRCVAVAFRAPLLHALSVSGPTSRMTDDVIERAARLLTAAAEQLVRTLDDRD